MKLKQLLALPVALLLVFSLNGCGTVTAPAATGKVFHYGTMAYGPAMQNASTDPHDTYCGWSTVRYGVGETLFKFDDQMGLRPWLARSYEQVDDYTIKIKLRDDVVFSNGKKMTGEAVKACLEDLLARNDRAPHDLKIDAMTADGQTLTIRSHEKMPDFINYLADPYSAIIDVDAGIHDRIAIGTGPYKAVRVDDQGLHLVKNENYWGPVKPKLDEVLVYSIPDGNTLTLAMQSGELDAVQGLPYASLPAFEKNGAYRILSSPTSRVYQAAMNYDTPALQDQRVRQAICLAIDKDNFVSVLLRGNGLVAAGPFPDTFPFGQGVQGPAYDLERAKELLREAGYTHTDRDGYVTKDGQPLTLCWLTYTSRQELPLLAEYAQASLKKAGIKVDVNATDNYKDFLKRGAYDIYAQAIVTAPTGDPGYYFMSKIYSGQPYNNGHYSSPVSDALIDRLNNTFDRQERFRLAREIGQQIVNDDAVFYASFLKMSVVMKKNVTGFAPHPCDYYEITPELDIH